MMFGGVDDHNARLEALRVSANVDVFTPVARDCVWPVPGLQVGVNTCGQTA